MSAPLEPIVTRVARCGDRDYRFLGCSIFDDLLGRESFLGLVALGFTGRRLAPEEVALLDDLAVVLTAADPRIWVPKASRLLASFGDSLAGLMGGQLCLVGARVGGAPVEAAGCLLAELRERLPSDVSDRDLTSEILPMLGGRDWIAGFGVPYRKHDQRFSALTAKAEKLGRATGDHFRLIAPLVEAVAVIKPGLPPNTSLPIAAFCLDLGFEPRHLGPLVATMLFVPTLANTFEESQLMSPALRELPVDAIEYKGPLPRRSPRASAASAPGADR